MECFIIPKPVECTVQEGTFNLSSSTIIFYSKGLEKVAKFLQNLLQNGTEIDFKIQEQDFANKNPEDNNGIYLILSQKAEEKIGTEGYDLEITPSRVEICGNNPAGVFYGIQTFRQLLPAEIETGMEKNVESLRIKCIIVVDYPRFAWRGFMLDECRHFWGKEIAKRMIDILALLKLNRFHWHLNEDQGWRIEIKKYPKLTEIGSVREWNPENKDEPHNLPDKTKYGGFYTQEEIKEVVAYAAERFITVVPEIEMPGHSTAAITAYPELSCTGGPFKVANTWGVFRDVYCGGKDSVRQFQKDVLDEVMALFPSPIIHIGGDEVPKDRWKECPDCQEKIRKEGLKDEEALQTHFTNEIAAYLEEKGRRLMGWNEILNDGLAKNAICHYWTGAPQKIIEHISNGRDTVVSRSSHIYLDHNHKIRPLSRVYGFDPIPKELPSNLYNHILGIESPLWTERIPTLKRADFQAFPRLIAVAETAWTPKELKNYNQFVQRLKVLEKRLDQLKVQYATENEFEPSAIKRFLLKKGWKKN